MPTKTKLDICVLDFSSAVQSDTMLSEVDTLHFLPSVESTGLKWEGLIVQLPQTSHWGRVLFGVGNGKTTL